MNFDREENDTRRAELVRLLEHSIERLTLAELEALYYDLVAKDYMRKYRSWKQEKEKNAYLIEIEEILPVYSLSCINRNRLRKE